MEGQSTSPAKDLPNSLLKIINFSDKVLKALKLVLLMAETVTSKHETGSLPKIDEKGSTN